TQIDYLYAYQNSLYTQINHRVYRIEQESLIETPIKIDNRIVEIYQIDSALYIITESMGVLIYRNSKIHTIANKKTNELLTESRIFSAHLQQDNQQLIIGSITNGVYIIDKNGEIIAQYNEGNGLQHSTVLSLKSTTNSIWLGLDGGIAHLHPLAPENYLLNANHTLGSVYCIEAFNNQLILGTNKGLFCYNPKSKHTYLIRGTQGQVWDIKSIGTQLIVSHMTGLMLIDTNFNIQKIHNSSWSITFTPNNQHLFLSATSEGLMLYEINDQKVHKKGYIKNYNSPFSNVVFDKYGHLWCNAPNKQLIKLVVDKDFQELIEIQYFSLDSTNVNYITLGLIDGDAVFYTHNCLYKYDITSNQVIKDEHLSKLFSAAGGRADKIAQYQNKFVYINGSDVGIIERNGAEFVNRGLIFQSLKNKMIPMQFRQVTFMNNKALLGFINGVASYNMDFKSHKVLPITVDKVSYNYQGQQQYCDISKLPNLSSIPNGATNFSFEISNLEQQGTLYVKLNQQNWQVHKVDNCLIFPFLQSGNHTIQLALSPYDPPIILKLNIHSPFVLSVWFYVLLISLILLTIPLSYTFLQVRVRRLKQRLLERQKINLENQRLAAEIKE
ncbi:MAG: hypothetical protein ACRC9X_00850, partial [Bacteroidales bacterium]